LKELLSGFAKCQPGESLLSCRQLPLLSGAYCAWPVIGYVCRFPRNNCVYGRATEHRYLLTCGKPCLLRSVCSMKSVTHFTTPALLDGYERKKK